MSDTQMPGAWICPECDFVLQKNILNFNSGSINADTSPLNEICPNDGKLMRPLTWREVNQQLFDQVCKLTEELRSEKQKNVYNNI